MWHASIAQLDMKRQRTMRSAEHAPSTRRLIVATAKALLEGVGQTPSMVEEMQLAIHYRRSITQAELDRLPAWWCEIPAVHQGGRGKMLEQNT